MTLNESRLLKILIGLVVIAISSINIMATRDAGLLFAESRKNHALATRSASVLATEIEAMRKELKNHEEKAPKIATSEATGQKKDILSVGYQSRKVLDEYKIKIVQYAMDKTASAELVTYKIESSSPDSFISFLKKIKDAPGGLVIPSCEIRIKDQTNEMEGQFSVGYEK